jgi:nucleoside-diphosphate-sugar epimerase
VRIKSREAAWKTVPDHRRPLERILVIGGAGYIGSALLPKLLERGYHVRVLDMLLYGTDPIKAVLGHPRLEIIQDDFRHVNSVVAATQRMDAVVHLGAIVGDPACALDEELTVEVNLIATRLIGEVAKGSGIGRFVFASTCSVYGAGDFVLDERSRVNPVSMYARSKVASERVLLKMAGHGFAPVILRFATIYGLSGRMRFDLVVNLLTAKALAEGTITVQGGDQWRPFLHVDDAALAVVQALTAPHANVRHQIFNVGSDAQNFTIRQIGQLIRRLVPEAEITEQPAQGDRRNYRVSFSKIKGTLDFKPQWTVEKGIQQVIEAIRAGQVADYREAKHSNVEFLRDESAARLIRHGNDWVYQLLNESGSDTIERPPAGLAMGGNKPQ